MDGISSIPLEDSVAFLKLRDQYKTSLLEDSRLNKAAGLAAQQELLLNSPADAAWKVPRLKSVNKQLRVWSQKIRQPGLPTGPGSPEEEEANLAIGPTQKFMGHIAQLKQRIKRPAVTPPAVPLVTPKLEQPSTSKSAPPSFGFKTKPYKPYKKKSSSGKKSKTPVYDSEGDFDTAAEDVDPLSPLSLSKAKASAKASAKAYGKAKAAAVIASVKQKAKQKAKEYALKKLQPQPGWEPFGGKPLKRKLHGKDWTATPKNPYKKKST